MKNLLSMGGACKAVTALLSTLIISIQLFAQDAFSVIRDVSMSGQDSSKVINTDNLFRKFVLGSNIKDADDGTIMRFVRCGVGRVPDITTAELPTFSWMTSSSEKKQMQAKFLKEVKAGTEYLFGLPATEKQTNIYRTLAYTANLMITASGKKDIVFWTDLVEASSAWNSYQYFNVPQKLLEDHDKIVQSLESDMMMPDLSGFTITFIIPGDREEVLWLSRFWTKYLQSKGAVVQVRTSY